MENQEDKKRSLAQTAIVEIGSDVSAIGAGTLIGGILLNVVDAIPGIGKPMKVLLNLGVYGIEIATAMKVRESMAEYIGGVCDAVNGIRSLFTPKPVVEQQGATVE